MSVKSGREASGVWLAMVVAPVVLPMAALAQDAPAKGTPQWIEYTLNLRHQKHSWTYDSATKSYTLSIVPAVTDPELPDYEGVSVNVPAVYVKGVDADGNLIIDSSASFVNPNGATYTPATAPIIETTGAAGYGPQMNGLADSRNAKYGYISVSEGNRGKLSQVTDVSGKVLYYTGKAPDCLVDQKAAARWVKYNVLLGNLPGDINRLVSTGGSGGAAHATMFAATSNNPDFYPYEADVGAVGVYKDAATGKYSAALSNGTKLSDGAWGSEAYSTISSLYEADAAQAFEYHLWPKFPYKSPFQAKLAEYLSQEYMEYINAQDLMADGKKLTIQYNLKTHPETNGYYGTYLDYMLNHLHQDLEWYLDNFQWNASWTKDDPKMSDMDAFLKGAYSYMQTGPGGPGGPPPGGAGGPGGPGGPPGAGGPGGPGGPPGAGGPGGPGGPPGGGKPTKRHGQDITGWAKVTRNPDGTYKAGFSLAAIQAYRGPKMNKPVPGFDVTTLGQEVYEFGSKDKLGRHFSEFVNRVLSDPAKAAALKPLYSLTDSKQFVDASGNSDFDKMVAAHQEEYAEIVAGDKFGNNIVQLYNPDKYIGAPGTENPTWGRIMMGGVEGDMPLVASMNIALRWKMVGVQDVILQWQWNGGHVPSDIFTMSFSKYVDEMTAKYK